VKVVDAEVAGGAAVTEEFIPGFRNSVAAYTSGLLNPQIIADLRLAIMAFASSNAGAEFPSRPRWQLSPHREGRTGIRSPDEPA